MRRSDRLLIAAYALLAVAWLFSTAPFAGPDEPAQYLRTLTISQGRLLGPRVPVDPAGLAWLRDGGWRAEEQRWVDQDRRGVRVPAALSPTAVPCLNDQPDSVGSCVEATYTGDYYPLAYLIPAVAMSPANGATTALWFARAASLIESLAFLLLAILLLAPGSRWRLLGMMAAITPMVLFTSTLVNPSGLELCANLAFICGLLRLTRDGAPTARWVWIATAVSGAVTVFAWQLGPLFAVVDIAVAVGVSARSRLRMIVRDERRALLSTAALLVTALILFLVWGAVSDALHSGLRIDRLSAGLHAGYHQLGPTLRGAVGNFGALDVPLPTPMPQLWWLLAAGLLAGALRIAKTRGRITLAATVTTGLVFVVLWEAWVEWPNGFGMQGRYALPLLVLVPLAAAETLDRQGGREPSPAVLRIAVAAVAIFQLVAWWVNAHHWARSSDLFLTGARWVPPVSWAPLLVAALASCCLLILAATTRLQRPSSSELPP